MIKAELVASQVGFKLVVGLSLSNMRIYQLSPVKFLSELFLFPFNEYFMPSKGVPTCSLQPGHNA